ncbi:MAG: IPT/TIG domain-containing protein [Deltaproteobacteria bacterium]|nr:IPT/TIG domain-containing protein [Deltaproteobacteria bacterium]
MIVPPKILLIDPSKGGKDGGDGVTIYGENFQQEAKVFFGEKEANVYSFKEDELTVKTPANPVGFVDVKVENPDGGSDVFIDGFEYVEPAVKNLPDWGRLNEPLEVTILTGDETPDLFAEVYEKDMTEGQGKNVNVLAQAGYGSKGSDPATWQWKNADYSGDAGNNDVFSASFSGIAEGEYNFSFRFSVDNGENWLVVDSDGTQNGFAIENAGIIKVLAPSDKPIITSIKPDFGLTVGGEVIEIKGGGFGNDVQLLLDKTFVTPDSITDTLIKFKTPKTPAGYVDVIVIKGSDPAVKQDGFLFVPKGSPVMDGDIGADWDETFFSAANTLETNWTGNSLKKLHFCYDNNNIYIGIEGTVESENYIVGYLDVNYGADSGTVKIPQLTDNSGIGELDDALSSLLDVKDANFSPELGFGTKGMQSFTKGNPLWPGSKEVGVRKFTAQDNFSWIDADVRADGVKGFVEIAIPIAETGIPLPLAKAKSMALFVRIINKNGDAASNQALPEYYNNANIFEVGDLFVVDIK